MAKKCLQESEADPGHTDTWSLVGGVGQQLAGKVPPKAWFCSGSEQCEGVERRVYMGSKRDWKFIK